MMGGAIPRLAVLNSIRKQAEQIMEAQASKQHPSPAFASVPAFRFPS